MTSDISLEDEYTVPGRHWHRLDDGRVQCDVCPRECRLHEGQRGLCFVRGRVDDQIVLTTYGRSSGFCVDPIEKKPLNHFLPGSRCCRSAPPAATWPASSARTGTSRSRGRSTGSTEAAGPDDIAAAAERLGCRSVAMTYNDPAIFLEYAVDVADACRARGIKAVAVTAGYIGDEPRRGAVRAHGRRQRRPQGVHRGLLPPRLGRRTCSRCWTPSTYLRHETDVWFEITTLLIPGHNDSDAEIDAECALDRRHLGDDVPAALHRVPPRLQDARRAAAPRRRR